MRFLLTRRWVLFGLAVALLALLSVRLGEWQFDRLHEREQSNAWARANLQAEPAPVGDVLEVGRAVPPQREWMRVEMTGRYDADATVVLRYQTRDGKAGVDLVTPLRTTEGPAVLVDRGWMSTGNTGDLPSALPEPPAGQVRVVGWVRVDATGDSTAVTDGSTRAVSSEAIGPTLPYPVYTGWVDAVSETPAPQVALVPAEPPDLGNGPHLFYGIQWWFFGALAVFGFGYLAYDERRRSRRAQPASTVDSSRA